MYEFSQYLGDIVKQSRLRLGLTQSEVADAAGIDNRTVLNIENYKGNPKLEVLYPLVRALHINPQGIFYPEELQDSPEVTELRMLTEQCTDREAATLIPIFRALLVALRNEERVIIE